MIESAKSTTLFKDEPIRGQSEGSNPCFFRFKAGLLLRDRLERLSRCVDSTYFPGSRGKKPGGDETHNT